MDSTSQELFWTDLRSKRNITPANLTPNTFENFQFYDPLLSPNVAVVRVAPGIDWLSQALPNSWQLNLHSFRFADYWLLQYLQSGDVGLLQQLKTAVLDYLDRVWANQKLYGQSKSKVYKHIHSDTAVANRAAVMALLLGQFRSGISNNEFLHLSEALQEHVAHAAADEYYNSNNHGLFNDLHLLMGLINAPDQKCLREAAPKILTRLLLTYLERQVNNEGIHLEHTPSYAVLWVLLGSKITEVLNRLALSFPDLAADGAKRVERSMALVTRNLWWFTKPNGELVNFGEQGRTEAASWIPDNRANETTRLFSESGYGFFKNDQTYLGFVAAYHSTKLGRQGYRSASHKQRDELHLVWYDAEGDVLIDPGLRAYDFGPERFYVTSKAAHNTVSVGEADVVGNSILEYMDQTSPYGGSVNTAEAFTAPDGSRWCVMQGSDPLLRDRGIDHIRTILFEPGRWLIIVDDIRTIANEPVEWNFHLHERWKSRGFSGAGAEFAAGRRTLSLQREGEGDVKADLKVGNFAPIRGWRFSGGPVAVSNLAFRETLVGNKVNRRVHAFLLNDGTDGCESKFVSFTMTSLAEMTATTDFECRLVDDGAERIIKRFG